LQQQSAGSLAANYDLLAHVPPSRQIATPAGDGKWPAAEGAAAASAEAALGVSCGVWGVAVVSLQGSATTERWRVILEWVPTFGGNMLGWVPAWLLIAAVLLLGSVIVVLFWALKAPLVDEDKSDKNARL
jgi:hypothetical protein